MRLIHKINIDKKVELFYDHYKDTFENQKLYLKKRNYLTIILLLFIATFAFQISNPQQTTKLSSVIIKKNVGDIEINFDYINNILLFGLFWVVLMYYQTNIHIEKTYKYLHKIEEQLTKNILPFDICREGKMYLNNYPKLFTFAHYIYTIIFPLTLIVVIIIKWCKDLTYLHYNYMNGHLIFNTIFILGIISLTVLYLIDRHLETIKIFIKIKIFKGRI